MKKLVTLPLIFAMALLLFVSGCGSQQSAVSGTAGAGPSGELVIYTSMYQSIVSSLNLTLRERFPDCRITFVYAGTGQLQRKVADEEAARRLGCDMLLVADPSYSIELREKGMLHQYTSPSAGNIAFDYDPAGYWYPVRVSNMVLAYNPRLTPKESVPNSFYDFAFDARFRGVVSMGNPISSGTTMAAVTALRDKYGYEYFDALGNQDVKVEAGAASLAKLETGEYKVVMILEESVLQKRQEENSNLEVIYPTDGTIIIPSTVMTIAEEWSASRNTRAAEIITEWFLSPEGQDAIVKGWMHSAMKDFGAVPHGSISTRDIQANSMPVNWENCFRQRDEIQSRFEEAVIEM